jgi:hypothetical protein
MKKVFLFSILSLYVFFAYAQLDTIFNKVKIDIDKKLLIIGEHHHIQEFYDLNYRMIEHIILHYPEINNFQLLIESTPCLNYYLDKLLLENDSVSLKDFLMHHAHRIQDTLFPMNQARYDFYMKFYYLSKSLTGRTFRFNCYDNTHILRPLVFTTLDILRKYPDPDTLFLSQITFLNSLLQKKNLDHDFYAFHQHIGTYFAENKEMLKNILTATDYFYFSEMMKRSPPFVNNPMNLQQTVTQERENMIYEQINNSYNDSTFFFCIIGAAHIYKPYQKKSEKPCKNNCMAAVDVKIIKMLETYKTSHFKDKIIICNSVPLVKKVKNEFNNKVFNLSGYYPPALQKHSEYLNSLLTDNITVIDMRKTKIKRAYKITDYMLVVKEANSLQ